MVKKFNLFSFLGEKVYDIIILLFIFLPIVILVLTGFKTSYESFTTLFIFHPTLENYTDILGKPIDILFAFKNSVVIAVLTVILTIPISVMAAYAFTRIRFKFSGIILTYVLACQFIPSVIMAMPYYQAMRNLRLLDTHIGLAIVNLSVSVPYAIWILQGYIASLPGDMEEAAYIDGCSTFQALWKITLPLIMPGVLTCCVLVFIQAWNEFLYALVMTKVNARTVTLALQSTRTDQGLKWGYMSAISTFVLVPVFVLSWPIRKYFVQGITAGSGK